MNIIVNTRSQHTSCTPQKPKVTTLFICVDTSGNKYCPITIAIAKSQSFNGRQAFIKSQFKPQTTLN